MRFIEGEIIDLLHDAKRGVGEELEGDELEAERQGGIEKRLAKSASLKLMVKLIEIFKSKKQEEYALLHEVRHFLEFSEL